MSWYPLGRPVGTTIYPAMQMTAVAIKHVLAAVGAPMSLNDVCCFIPCWFGVSASLLTGALAYECSGSKTGGAAAVMAMAIMPAHLMRSIGGGYDNESIAVTAMARSAAARQSPRPGLTARHRPPIAAFSVASASVAEAAQPQRRM